MLNRLVVGLALGAAVAAFAATGPADARIRCNGDYQQNRSGEVLTPYCQEENLAQVARSYGKRVSGAQIRASYGLQKEVCQLIGNDNRVVDYCNRFRTERPDRCTLFPC